MDGPVVLVLRVLGAILLIAVGVVENLVEVLLGMSDIPQQLRIELKDASSMQVGVALIIHTDMLMGRAESGKQRERRKAKEHPHQQRESVSQEYALQGRVDHLFA